MTVVMVGKVPAHILHVSHWTSDHFRRTELSMYMPEDGALLPSEQFLMTSRPFLHPQMRLEDVSICLLYINPRLFQSIYFA